MTPKLLWYHRVPTPQQSNTTLSKTKIVSVVAILLSFMLPNRANAQFGASACMGANTVKFNFATSTLLSGTANTVGVKYKFANANVGGSTSVDVIAELIALQYGTLYDATKYTFVYDQQGNPPSVTGFGIDGNFQPSFIATAAGATNFSQAANTNENIFSTWKFSFVLNSNNTIPVFLPLVAQVIDNDGVTGSSIAPQSQQVREGVTSITNPTAVTLAAPTQQTIAGNTITGPAVNQAGIGVGTDFAAYYFFNNVSTFTMKFNHNISVGATTIISPTSSRYSSMHLGCDYAGTPNFVLQSISGNVYNDANGITDNTVNGTGTNAAATLYAILYDNTTGNVLETTTVAADGTYNFEGITPGHNYTVYISTTNAPVGQLTVPVVTPPAGYTLTGEFFGTGVGSDGTPNGILPLGVVNATVGNANFGIEQIPVGNNFTATAQANPGGTTQVTVPSAAFTGTDAEDGAYATGLSGKKVTLNPATNGTLYYNGVAVNSSTTITGFNPALVTIDPAGAGTGAITPTFTYSVFDAADQPSAPKTISMPFGAPITLSGNVFNDPNGNAVQNAGENGTNAGGLNAVLTDASGNVIETVAVNAAGVYTFTKATSSTNYNVVLTTTTPVTGSVLTTSSLPNPASGTWVNTGVNPGGATPTPGNTTGILAVTTPATGNVTNQNFAIEQTPAVNNFTATAQANPGGTLTVRVPAAAFTGNDATEGAYAPGLSGRKVTLNPATNGTLYYNGVAVNSSTTITNFDPSLVTIDPAGAGTGAITPSFTYSVFDAADKPSTPATINMPFGPGIVLSGSVFNDKNGDAISTGDTFTNAGGLFAVLTDAAGNVIESVAVNGSGVYTFTSATSSSAYNVVLSTTSPATGTKLTASSLPTSAAGNWVNTGVNPGGASPTTANKTGILAVNTPAAGNVTNQNFGIEQLPISNTQSYNIATPTGNSFLTLNGTGAAGSPGPLTGSDAEDQPTSGSLSAKNIRITSLPTNGNELWYNGAKISFGADGTTAPSPTNPLTITNYNPSLLQIRFTGTGSMSTSFNYSYVDAAGNPSSAAASYTVSWLGVLPVTITAISAEENNGVGLVKWSTQQETSLLVYTVERSENGTEFVKAGDVSPLNTGVASNYLYSDNLKNVDASIVYYRLKIVNNDGSFKYSTIVKITRSKTPTSLLISPNPVMETMQIKVNAAVSAVAVIKIVSTSGQVMYTAKQQLFKGMNSVQINNLSAKLAKGTYILTVSINNENLKAGFVF